jgi:hypothetical protein
MAKTYRFITIVIFINGFSDIAYSLGKKHGAKCV